MNFDVTRTPFSRYGSYMAVSVDPDEDALVLHHVRKPFGRDRVYLVRFEAGGGPVQWSVSATPWELVVQADRGTCRLAIASDDTVALSATGLGIRLSLISGHGYGTERPDGSYELISVPERFYSQLYVLEGTSVLAGPVRPNHAGRNVDRRTELRVSPCDGRATVLVRVSPEQAHEKPAAFDCETLIEHVRREWEAFHRRMPAPPARYRPMADTSWYNLWSCFVRAEDCYRHDAILMSKKSMCSIWSWDHCFNALALSRADAEIALNQFLLPFELQAESGALPDFWNPNLEVVWGVTKPPIHGWCFTKLLAQHDFSADTLRRVCRALEKWTLWWLEYRDTDGDGIPDYPQGCDSGWDNATVFDHGYFVESPDLPAFLVLQMQAVADLRARLGEPDAARHWRSEADALLQRLYDHSWNGDRFVARLSRSHETPEPQTSLLTLMPLVLGDRLDRDKFRSLTAILERDFLTDDGLATEMPASPQYEPDGYWRGPIWAPSTYLIVDGLRRGGRADLAREIARRFCDMIQFKAGGNYENFDALTGRGLRAPGYTWTASVNLLLMWEYLKQTK